MEERKEEGMDKVEMEGADMVIRGFGAFQGVNGLGRVDVDICV